MAFKKGKCTRCENYGDLVFSNNPLVPSICIDCVHESIDVNNLEHADMFCRTYNIPFNPDRWTKILEKTKKEKVIEIYTKQFLNENKDNLFYKTTTSDLWKKANKEWEKTSKHIELIEKIKPIKKSFLERGIIKWGSGFSFEDLIQLENLFSTTVSAFDINNPMQIDIVKKACKISLMVDQSIMAGEVKDIKELSTAFNQLLKMAQIDEMIESANSDVIRTVADLVDHLEKSGFKFDWYDDVERDVYDKTINSMKEYLRTLVLEATGLEQELEGIRNQYEKAQVETGDKKAVDETPIHEIVEETKRQRMEEIEEELDSESIIDEGDFDE